MTASSVTGIGQGSADKSGQRGSEHMFLGVEKLVGPRVVLAGVTSVATGNTATIGFSKPLDGVAQDYAVFVTSYSTNSGAAKGAHAFAVPGGNALPTQTGTLAGGSTSVTSLTSTLTLSPGMSVTGTGVPTGTTIASISTTNETSLTLSQAAATGGANTLTFGVTGTYPMAGFSVYVDDNGTPFAWEVVRVNNATVQVN